MQSPLYAFDSDYCLDAGRYLAGVDEAGRGPLAGPVVAAAVIFVQKEELPYLNDSKKLSAKRREILYKLITENAFVGIGSATEAEIDLINIYQASRLAMKRALLNLNQVPDFVLIDGNMSLDIEPLQKSVIKGDQKSASIAAASIIAKVYRDNHMTEADALYPGYAFAKHKGYGTKTHLEALESLGPSPIHRKTFAPVRTAYERIKQLV